jgi:hypothetical protein
MVIAHEVLKDPEGGKTKRGDLRDFRIRLYRYHSPLFQKPYSSIITGNKTARSAVGKLLVIFV